MPFAPPTLRHLLADIWNGQSVLRSLEDRALRAEVVLKGRILDLGSGVSGYLGRLSREGRVFPVTVDIRPETGPNIIANLERGLPFRDRSIETVLLHNVLE